jgi:hypothetical protein
MGNDHDLRADCAADFATVHTEIERVKNGHETQATALDKLTGAVEIGAVEVRRNHSETVRMISGYQGSLVALFSKQSERTAIVEQKSASAHHRLDGQYKAIWAIVGLILTVAVGIIAKAMI